MWKKKPVFAELAFPVKQKEKKGFAELMHWPEISKIQIENSWDFNTPFAKGQLDSVTLVRNSLGTANLTGTLSREIIPFWTGAISATLGQSPNLTANLDYSPRPDRYLDLFKLLDQLDCRPAQILYMLLLT